MNERMKILIVEDEANMRKILSATLQRLGYQTQTSSNGFDALNLLKENYFSIVITDLKMPKMDGLTLLKRIHIGYPDIPVIILTAHGTVETAVQAMKHGAFDYITKPFEMDELTSTVNKAFRAHDLNAREVHDPSLLMDEGIVARSQQLKSVLSMAERVADSPTTILITGESGTGKELIAKLIHKKSGRKDAPFIKINCAAVPENLLESEFFGYEKGAFTGAVTSKPGRFELADTGTLFLDEIGEVPKEMQVKLLRVIQEMEFERVGGLKTIKVDVRLVVATNVDLKEAVEKNMFRQDLYYRLNVVEINLPPLRNRPDDISPLVYHFIRKFNHKLSKTIEGITPEVEEILRTYKWPGNIRELENVMERAVLLSPEPFLEPHLFKNLQIESSTTAELTPDVTDGSSFKDIVQSKVIELERDLLDKALKESGGNVTRTAKKLGLSRKGLQLKIKKYGLKPGSSYSDIN